MLKKAAENCRAFKTSLCPNAVSYDIILPFKSGIMYFMPHLFSRVLATFTDIDLVLSIYGRTNFEKKRCPTKDSMKKTDDM